MFLVWKHILVGMLLIVFESLSKGERRTPTGSEAFSLLIRLDATKFKLHSVYTLIKTICTKTWSKSGRKKAKGLLPVDMRR